MAGLLNASQAPSDQSQSPMPAGDGNVDNQILTKIQDGVEAKVLPAQRKNYMALTVAGMKIMFSEGTGQRVMQKLKSSQDIVSDVSKGVANVLATVFNQVAPSMPPEKQGDLMAVSVPASIMLMCQALDAWEQITGQTVTNEIAAACTNATTKEITAKFNITPEMMKEAVAKGQDPKGQQAQPQPMQQPMPGA